MPEQKQPIRPEDSIQKMLQSLPEKTGKSFEEWSAIIATHEWVKHGEIVAGLKGEYGVAHAYANQIALKVRAATETNNEDPVAELFAKRPEAKAVFEALMPRLQGLGPDVDTAPKKGYLSIRRKKQFVILQPAAGRLDVGIQLKGVEPAGRLEASGSFNAMLTHRVRVQTPEEVNEELIGWLSAAYQAAG